MKVLHIIDSGGLYGAEVMLLNLIAEQIKLGADPVICSIGELNISEKPLEKEARKRGFKVEIFRMRPGPNILGALKVLRFAHREHFNLMHSHGYKGNILFGFIPRKIRKIPLLSTLHGWTNTGSLNRMKIYEWLDSKSLKYIDAIVVVNKAMLSNPEFGNQNGVNLFTINNGIPSHELNINTDTLDKEIINFCRQGFTIGSIGRLSTEKGFDFLIGAVHKLIKNGIDLRLVIIGEGYKRDELQQEINKQNLSGKVYLPGYRNSANQYLPFFNIFALSSFTEGLPITMLEAMQAKIPIVATKVGGIPDVLENGITGILVSPYDTTGLAEGILTLYKDRKLRTDLTVKAEQTLKKEYTSSKMAKQYYKIYKEL